MTERSPDRIEYDEFSFFSENAEEFGLPYDGPPAVRRQFVAMDDGRLLSALVWGTGEPELVLLHGGAQNAHTWDTVALALGRPLLAVDLPGHGHSDGFRRGAVDLDDNAADVGTVIRALAPDATAVVGMSLGGMTAMALAGQAPELVRRLVLVDILPTTEPSGVNAVIAFVNGPPSFASFDEILERTVKFNPTRSVSSLRRGILHNAVQGDDGTWVWRHARHPSLERDPGAAAEALERFTTLWDVIGALTVPLMLVRGLRPGSAVNDEGEAELRRRLPSARIEYAKDSGHSIQGDEPVLLARLIDDFVP